MCVWFLRVPCTEVVSRAESHTLMRGGFSFIFGFTSGLCDVPQKFLKLAGKLSFVPLNRPTTTWGALLVHKQEMEKDSTGHRAEEGSRCP